MKPFEFTKLAMSGALLRRAAHSAEDIAETLGFAVKRKKKPSKELLNASNVASRQAKKFNVGALKKNAELSKIARRRNISHLPDIDNLTQWDTLSDEAKKRLGTEANMKSWDPNLGRKPRTYHSEKTAELKRINLPKERKKLLPGGLQVSTRTTAAGDSTATMSMGSNTKNWNKPPGGKWSMNNIVTPGGTQAFSKIHKLAK